MINKTVAKINSFIHHAMQQFLLVFIRFIDCYLILALQNPLHHTLNISLTNNATKSIHHITTNDFDNPEIPASLNHFIKWFTIFLVIFSVFIALVCPFLLWILQERCLYRSSTNRNSQSTTLITTPRLLLVDQRTKIQSTTNKILSNSSEQRNSYFTPATSLSVHHMV